MSSKLKFKERPGQGEYVVDGSGQRFEVITCGLRYAICKTPLGGKVWLNLHHVMPCKDEVTAP